MQKDGPREGPSFCHFEGLRNWQNKRFGHATLRVEEASGVPPNNRRMLEAGTILQDRYEIEKVLGQGGFGCVYLGREKVLHKHVAVKEMHVPIMGVEQRAKAILQFQAEARMLASLRHPRLVDVSHYFEENRHQYLVMEYVQGQTLGDLARAVGGPFPVEQVVHWLGELCELLDYLHTRTPPVVLRDMKPGNIMVEAGGGLRVIDFGIARTLEAGSATSTFLRGTGSHGFAPVEQYGQSTDTRSDIYSLGATMYYCLTFTVPPPSVTMLPGGIPLEPPSSINGNVSPELEAVVLKMMALRQDDRYQSAAEVKRAVEAMVHAQLHRALLLHIAPAGRPGKDKTLEQRSALPFPLGEEGSLSPTSQHEKSATAPLPSPASWTVLLVDKSGPADEWERTVSKYGRRFQVVSHEETAALYLDEHPTTAVILTGAPSHALAVKCHELQVPFCVVSDSPSTALRLEVTALGCCLYFVAPGSVSAVVDAVEAVIQAYYRPPPVVMIVDDDPIALTAIEGLFELEGIVVHCQQDPLLFWETLAEVQPDYLILDMEMPGASGLELCRSVRADVRWRPLPILILTSNNDAQSIDAVYAAGADDYASKPIFVSDLVTRIRSRLTRQAYLLPPQGTDRTTGG